MKNLEKEKVKRFRESMLHNEEYIASLNSKIDYIKESLIKTAKSFVVGYLELDGFDLDLNFEFKLLDFKGDSEIGYKMRCGYYRPTTRTIVINTLIIEIEDNKLLLLSTLVHEIIHAYQIERSKGRYADIDYKTLCELEDKNNIDYLDKFVEIDARMAQLKLMFQIKELRGLPEGYEEMIIRQTLKYKEKNRILKFLELVKKKDIAMYEIAIKNLK